MREDARMAVRFYFGAMSPYSWFAAERIGDLLPDAEWVPVFAGALFSANGRTSCRPRGRGFRATRRFRGATGRVSSPVVDGARVAGNVVPLAAAGRTVTVEALSAAR